MAFLTRREEMEHQHPHLFADMQLPWFRQEAFIKHWHGSRVSVSELARRVGISRPSCYKLIDKLEARGDIRGEICNGEPVSMRVVQVEGDLTYATRRDLLRKLRDYNEFAKAAMSYVAAFDADFVGALEEGSETDGVDLQKLTDRLVIRRRSLSDRRAAGRRQNGLPDMSLLT